MNILFRSCSVVEKTSRGGYRPFGMTKEEIILKSLKSILESSKGFEQRIYLDIVDDSSPSEFIKRMANLTKRYKINHKIHKINVKNNGKSMKYCFDLAGDSK